MHARPYIHFIVIHWIVCFLLAGECAVKIMLGRAAMLNHDFPRRYLEDSSYEAVQMPVTPEYLKGEGLSDKFLDYIRPRWPEFFVEST